MTGFSDNVRRRYAGWLLWAMILLSLTSVFITGDLLNIRNAVAGLVAGTVVLLLLPDVRRLLFVQATVLIIVGVGLMLAASANGQRVDWLDALSRNTTLLSMIVAVGLLRLVMLDFTDLKRNLPTGRFAFLQTLLAVGVFGSIINISGPILIADRLSAKQPLNFFTAASLSKVFCSCAAWSPFFGGMAVVLVYTETASLGVLMLHGLPFFFLAVQFVYISGSLFQSDKVELFEGYPLSLQSLWAPFALSVLVFAMYWWFPGISILIVIIAASVGLPLVYLLLRRGVSQAANKFGHHISTEFCKSQNELLLFMAAGILAAGLSHYLASVDIALPDIEFGAKQASLLLALMIFVAAMGIHPVIQIAVITPLLQPLSPSPDLLGMVYLFSWSLGTCASPLSGTHLIIQGRYGVPAWKGAVQNWPFVGGMYWVAVVILYVLS